MAAPYERTGADQDRGEAGPLEGCIGHLLRGSVLGGLQAKLENMLWACQILELTHSQVGEHDIVGQRVNSEFGCRTRAKNLATRRQRPQPCSTVDRPTEV